MIFASNFLTVVSTVALSALTTVAPAAGPGADIAAPPATVYTYSMPTLQTADTTLEVADAPDQGGFGSAFDYNNADPAL